MNLHVLFVRNQSCWWNLKSTALHLNEYTMEPKQDPQTPPAQLLKSQWKFKHWVSLTLLTVQFESYSSFWAVLLFSSNLQVTDNVNTVRHQPKNLTTLGLASAGARVCQSEGSRIDHLVSTQRKQGTLELKSYTHTESAFCTIHDFWDVKSGSHAHPPPQVILLILPSCDVSAINIPQQHKLVKLD